ncbi:myeloid leukemia factor 1-like [Bolinopsis microptera]|uniref:myeloid leukemia factor 1-like n=1 Tax=Bolinopsis microptera TaxID=2820187 RepID=UPI00307A2B8F
MFRGFDDDPFFREFNDGMRRTHGDIPGSIMGRREDMFKDMDNMMNSMMRGFGGNMGMLEGPRESGTDRQVAERRPNNARNFFPDMGSLARQVDEMAKDGNGYSFSSQQVYSYRNDGSGEPQKFQATSSTAKGPGGIKETKKGFKDSTKKTQKMQYGRHIADRAAIKERSQVRDQRQEKTDYFGLNEAQAPDFNREWGTKASGLYRPSFADTQPAKNRGIDRTGRREKKRALPQAKK